MYRTTIVHWDGQSSRGGCLKGEAVRRQFVRSVSTLHPVVSAFGAAPATRVPSEHHPGGGQSWSRQAQPYKSHGGHRNGTATDQGRGRAA